MSGLQLTFAVIGTILTAVGLAWTITWAFRSWRKSGADVTADLGQGYVDKLGILHVFFQDGRSKITRIEGDPWERRKTAEQRKPGKTRAKTTSKPGKSSNPENGRQAVNAVFVRNRGRSAITVTRCLYVMDLSPERVFSFEPQPHASPWGDLLPKRVEAGHEIVLLHDKRGIWELLNGVMRDHAVFQTVYGVYLELGDGAEIYAGPPILTQANMGDEEYQEASKRLHREEYERPELETPRRSRLRQWRIRRRLRRTLVMDDDLRSEENPSGPRP